MGRGDPQGGRELPGVRANGSRSPSCAGWAGSRARPRARTPIWACSTATLAQRIAAAADEIAQGKHDDQFPIDVFQTGSGTSSNMNANEVIATIAGDGAHPNDHVNMGQSSNDVFPSAVHLAALDEATNRLLPALERLEKAFADKAEAFKDIVKSGRTHLMDAVPVTLGQEFAGYAAQVRLGRARVCRTRSRRSPRSRSAAPPPAPASTPTATSPPRCARR